MPLTEVISIGEFRSTLDFPPLEAGRGSFATVAKNVLPDFGSSYIPELALVEVSTGGGLDAFARGAYSGIDDAGNVKTFAADATKIYELIGTTFTDKSKAGGYSNAIDSMWEATQFKDSSLGNIIIFTNFDDEVQFRTTTGTLFADLGTNTPKARHVASLENFVVLGNTFDSDGNVPTRVRWSSINNPTGDWTPSPATQADLRDLRTEAGWVQNITSFQDYAVVFQERAVWRMTFIGGAAVFELVELEQARGLFAQRSAIAIGPSIFYISDDGFYALNGTVSTPIGDGRIDKFFFDDLDANFLFRVTVATFPDKKIIKWIYPGAGNTDGCPNKYIAYNWASNRWAHGDQEAQLIFRNLSKGFTLEELDSITTDIETLSPSLDSKTFMGGVQAIGAFSASNKLGTFTGSALEATLETSEFGDDFASITEVWPMIDGGTHFVTMGTRNTQAGTTSFGTEVSENSTGFAPVRSTARYHRARFRITGGFNHVIGIRARLEPSGLR